MQMVEITQNELFHLLLSSLRYAYGRKTYIVSDTCDWIKKYSPQLADTHQAIILKELTESLKTADPGHDCDLAQWKKLLNVLMSK